MESFSIQRESSFFLFFFLSGIYTDPQRLECRDLGEDFIYPCVRREGAEEILEIDISMATTSLPEREEHSEKRFCCTYTPSVSSDEKQQTSPSSSTSSSSSDQAEMKERNPSFSREKDCASLRLPNPVKILLDGVEQKVRKKLVLPGREKKLIFLCLVFVLVFFFSF